MAPGRSGLKEAMGRQRGGGQPGQATLLPGVGGGAIPNQSLIHKSTLGRVAATHARTHTRAHTRARAASSSCGWPSAGMARRVSG